MMMRREVGGGLTKKGNNRSSRPRGMSQAKEWFDGMVLALRILSKFNFILKERNA